MGFKITKTEARKRTGYILLSIFAFYVVEPLRDWVNSIFDVSPFIIGIGGIILTLYLFDFD